jgi:4-methyl-5(b-hydroxyethyl)-thiazole monophosphate biosynthesis
MSKKVCAVFGDGTEEIEIVTPVDILVRCGVEVSLISAKNSTTISGAHGIKFVADKTIDQLDDSIFDCLLLPGGPGTFTLKDNSSVLDAVRAFANGGKLVCAICAAPIILHNAGVLNGKKFCSHPCVHSVLTDADRNARVVVDGNVITSKGPGVAAEFAFAIASELCGAAIASGTRGEMFFS